MKTHVLRAPVAFSNAPFSTCWQDFWMDVLLGYTYFDLISPMTHTWIFFEHLLHGLLEDVPLHVRQITWFQHHGAPPHFTRAVQRSSVSKIWANVDNHGGPIAWPSRLLDLAPLDYFLWGQNFVYETPACVGYVCCGCWTTSYIASQILRAASDGCHSRPWLVCRPLAGRHTDAAPKYSLCYFSSVSE